MGVLEKTSAGEDIRCLYPHVLREARVVDVLLEAEMPFCYVSGAGIRALEKPGIQAFEDAGVYVPYNLGVHPDWAGKWMPSADAQQVLERTARVAGWMAAAAKMPAIKKVLKRSMQGSGVNSPYCVFTPMDFFVRYPSPGRFEDLLWKVKRRAEWILNAYAVQNPSWMAIARALMITSVVGKAAVLAVAFTLSNGESFRSYRQARQWLVANRTAAMVQLGESLYYMAKPVLEHFGAKVYAVRDVDAYGRYIIGKRHVVQITGVDKMQVMDSSDPKCALMGAAEQFFEGIETRNELEALSPSPMVQEVLEVRKAVDAILHDGWGLAPSVVRMERVIVACVWGQISGDKNAFEQKAMVAVQFALYRNVAGFSYQCGYAAQLLESVRDDRFPVADNSDGVEVRRAAEPSLIAEGCEVFRIRKGTTDFRLMWLVRAENGRTFHANGFKSAYSAILEAQYAWGIQGLLAVSRDEATAFLDGSLTGACPLIDRQDGALKHTGNCTEGTESWLLNRGWHKRPFIPGPWLIPFLGDIRVQRVVLSAMKLRQVTGSRTKAA